MIEWIRALSPIIVAIIPVMVTVVTTANRTRRSASEDIAKARQEILQVKAVLDNHITADEENEQKQRRFHILRFADDVSKGAVFSDEYWSEISDTIDQYRTYCRLHPEYQNSKGEVAMEYIKELYKEHLKHGKQRMA